MIQGEKSEFMLCFARSYLQKPIPILNSLFEHADPHHKYQRSNQTYRFNRSQRSDGQRCCQKKIQIGNSAELLEKCFG